MFFLFFPGKNSECERVDGGGDRGRYGWGAMAAGKKAGARKPKPATDAPMASAKENVSKFITHDSKLWHRNFLWQPFETLRNPNSRNHGIEDAGCGPPFYNKLGTCYLFGAWELSTEARRLPSCPPSLMKRKTRFHQVS